MNVTRVVEFKAGSQLGSVYNPIAAMGLSDRARTNELLMETVVPLESITSEEWSEYLKLPQVEKRKLIFQTHLRDVNLTNENLELLHKMGVVCQIWIDKPFREKEKQILLLALKYSNVEIVYCPRLLFHPSEFDFTDFGTTNITVHICPQENEFDSWPTELEFWHHLLWIESRGFAKTIKTQIFKEKILELTPERRAFYLFPHPESFAFLLKKGAPASFMFHRVILKLSRMLSPSLLQFLQWPLSKPYWVIMYQIKKRILKNAD